MLGEFSGKHEADSGLDLARAESRLLVVSGELSGLGGNALKDIVDEGVHHGHALLRDTSVGVDLLQDLVDVRRVGLDALLGLFSGSSGLTAEDEKTGTFAVGNKYANTSESTGLDM